MKHSLICLYIALSIFFVKGQDSLKGLELGMDVSMGKNAIGRPNILPGIVLTKNKHSVFCGPALIYGIAYNPYRPKFGLQMGYQYYPNGTKNRFNLFFEYDFNYLKTSFTVTKYNFKKNIQIQSIDNYFGFGFKYNIYKGIYLKTNVGFGIIYYSNTFTGAEGFFFGNFYPYSPYQISYYYGFTDKYFVGLFKIGMGFNLYSFKKH